MQGKKETHVSVQFLDLNVFILCVMYVGAVKFADK